MFQRFKKVNGAILEKRSTGWHIRKQEHDAQGRIVYSREYSPAYDYQSAVRKAQEQPVNKMSRFDTVGLKGQGSVSAAVAEALRKG